MEASEFTSTISNIDRRSFLKIGSISASGLILGVHFGCSPGKDGGTSVVFNPNVYLNINSEGVVTIIAHRSEMGQGVRTALPMIVADELEADWEKVEIVQAEGDEEKYGNQNTDGSFTVRMFYEPMRIAGATARMMLEQAAAKKWGVNANECQAQNNEVIHTSSDKKAGFGELAALASEQELPAEDQVKLKDPKDFKYIGIGVNIVDSEGMVNGTAVYGMDYKLDNAKIAVIQRCPVDGGKIASFSNEETMKVPGVLQVFNLESPGFPTNFQNPLGGVVVIAEDTYSALKGREALNIEWDSGPNADYNSQEFQTAMEQSTLNKGSVRREEGDFDSTVSGASNVIESVYKIPHLAHSTMEPPCAAAKFENGKCEVWAPTQHPQWARNSIAEALELDPKDVTVNVTLLGGGFGRKSKPDFVVEAAKIAKESGFPIKLIWTREDDIAHDFFHAVSVQRIKVTMNENKDVTGWNQHTVFPSIGGTASSESNEPSMGELGLGLVDFPYDIPNIRIESHKAETRIRTGWLRSVCNIQHAFGIGSMMDEIAEARGMDPVENLLDLLGEDRKIPFNEMVQEFPNYNEELDDYPWDTGRLRNVINLVAEKSQWGKELPEGSAQGITAHRSFLTYVACVVEVETGNDGSISIPEIHYAVDCGLVVNPDRVISQFEGGAVFGAGIALNNMISVKNGQVEQSNFDTYHVPRMNNSPKKVYVHLVDSKEKPTGVGEPPVPPVAPALCNAIYAATGKRIRELPIKT